MVRRKISAKERGFIIIGGGVLLLVMLPLAGLAVDAAFLYAIKTRLSAAVDAAAISASRSLSVGMTMAAQETSALTRAQAFFNANYTAETWNTVNRSLNISVQETGLRTRTVSITASVDAPLYFMRILWPSPTTVVTATGVASRRDTNVLLVLDRSGSMNNNGGCPAMRAAANAFVDLFANERDRLGMITYGVAYSLSYAPNRYFKNSSPALPDVIDTITCGGGTGSAQALFKGYEQIVQINEPGALNVILFFTDGIPNTVTANFPVNINDTTRTADVRPAPATVSNSRCYDYAHNKRWFLPASPGSQHPAWNPANQVYRGAVFAEEGSSGPNAYGVNGYTTSDFTDPGTVTAAYASATATSPQAASGYEDDCWFRGGSGHNGTSQGTGRNHVQYDIAYYPDNDLYGTALRSGSNFRPIVSFPAGHPYAGKIDVRQVTNMNNAAINAVDNMGKRIREGDLNPDILTVVYTIGLGEVGADQHTLLRRVANDPLSPVYDASRPTGIYLHAPTASDLLSSFARIASEVLRFSS